MRLDQVGFQPAAVRAPRVAVDISPPAGRAAGEARAVGHAGVHAAGHGLGQVRGLALAAVVDAAQPQERLCRARDGEDGAVGLGAVAAVHARRRRQGPSPSGGWCPWCCR